LQAGQFIARIAPKNRQFGRFGMRPCQLPSTFDPRGSSGAARIGIAPAHEFCAQMFFVSQWRVPQPNQPVRRRLLDVVVGALLAVVTHVRGVAFARCTKALAMWRSTAFTEMP